MNYTVTAKPIDWKRVESVDGAEYFESRYGFYITEDSSEPEENRFYAAWGEGDGEYFPSLDEAKTYCQDEIDSWISNAAVVTAA